MSDVLDAPGVPCIECERTICGEPHWLGEAGPLCDGCSITIWATFQQFLMERRAPAPDPEKDER